FAAVDESLAEAVADAIVSFQAAEAGMTLAGPQSKISGELYIEGLRNADEAGKLLIERYAKTNVGIERTSIDGIENKLITRIQGAPVDIATIIELLMAGELIKDRAMSIEYRNGVSHD